jgi:hypothetical protein
MNLSRRITASIMTVLCLLGMSSLVAQEKVDLETISRIRYEGFRNSKVMEIASGLVDEIGALPARRM